MACCVSFPFYFFPRWLKATGVLTSNKEGEVICEIDALVLGGGQFGVLVKVLFGALLEVLVRFYGWVLAVCR